MNNECINEAAQLFQVNPLLIKAIIWKESHNKPGAINFNNNNTRDIGIMQINSIHLSSLKSFGFDESQLRNDSCVNVFAGTWILSDVIKRYGYTWNGIGYYHSKTKSFRQKYIHDIINILQFDQRVLNTIEIPYKKGLRERFAYPR